MASALAAPLPHARHRCLSEVVTQTGTAVTHVSGSVLGRYDGPSVFLQKIGAFRMRKNPVYDWVYTSQAEPLATLAKSSSARKSGGSSPGTGDKGVLPNRASAGTVVLMGGESFSRALM